MGLPLQDKNGGDILLGRTRVALRDLDPEMLSPGDDDDPAGIVRTQLSMPAVTVRLRQAPVPHQGSCSSAFSGARSAHCSV
jgi:hypothetical protein